jgi:ubiquinone/menaquinone biosynthesis C-methylase UbiE
MEATPTLAEKNPPVHSGADDVRALFNEKAAQWQRKYAPGGPLALRLEQFGAALAGHIPLGGRVLDLGCGTGNLAAHLSRTHAVDAADIAERMLSVARVAFAKAPVRWHLLEPSWRRLPFEDCSVDAVVSSSVFEYLPDVHVVLAECQRVLRSGGCLLVTVPNPTTTIRRVEAVVRRVVPMVPKALLGARVDRYLRYLELSQNRWPLTRWRALFDAAGFDVQGGDVPPLPLVLLTLRRR